MPNVPSSRIQKLSSFFKTSLLVATESTCFVNADTPKSAHSCVEGRID